MTSGVLRGIVLLAGLSALLCLLLVVQYWGDAHERPTLFSEAELRALPADQLESQIVNDLTKRLVYAGYSPDAWRKFKEPAQHLYAVATVEASISGYGLDRLLSSDQVGGDPGITDAITAYDAMGMVEVSRLLTSVLPLLQARERTDDVQKTPVSQIDKTGVIKRYVAALGDAKNQGRRRDFILGNLSDIANP